MKIFRLQGNNGSLDPTRLGCLASTLEIPIVHSILMRRLLQFTLALCALGIVLLFVLLFQGSAELFPTDEQEEKLRIAIGFLVFLLTTAAGISLMVLKRLKCESPSPK